MPAVIGQDNTVSGFDPGLANPRITFGVWGDSGNGTGILGTSAESSGVSGSSSTGTGVEGHSAEGIGVAGVSDGTGGTGVIGKSRQGTAVAGQSEGGTGVSGSSPHGTGVEGLSADGTGVFGRCDAGVGVIGSSGQGTGVAGQTDGSGTGVSGSSPTGTGVEGSSMEGAGVSGRSNGAGAGVIGSSAQGVGVIGESDGSGSGVIGRSTSGIGVSGTSRDVIGVEGTSPLGTGISGRSDAIGTGVIGSSVSGVGVSGTSRDSTAITGVSHDFIGISGRSGHSDTGGFGHGFAANQAPGVFGATFNGDGVYGFSQKGVGARAEGGTTGIIARGATLAGDFEGNVRVSGTLTKGGGGFKIDHPLDQENRYLAHSFVESPEMKNFYDGLIILNGDGEATVELPAWFEALNETFRYQLAAIGGPAPSLHISRKLADGRFSIAGGEPQMEVCWQVTGVRRDPWAMAHPLVVEEDKTPEEQGYYLHPEEHGQSAERDVSSIHHPARPRLLPADEVE